jgi:phosphoheptose isomerase
MAQKTMAEAVAKEQSKRDEFESQVEAITDAGEYLLKVDAAVINTETLDALKTVIEHGISALSLANELGVVRNLYGIHPASKAAKAAKPKAGGLFRR